MHLKMLTVSAVLRRDGRGTGMEAKELFIGYGAKLPSERLVVIERARALKNLGIF